jgi:phospholysine phosphohistidine inorganic pyrophosphate phosphatase
MKAILFDLDGVLYTGENAIEGAADVINWCVHEAVAHLFLTNTTSRPRAALVDKLAGFSIVTNPDDFLTPALAARQWLNNNINGKIALFIPEATLDEFTDFEQCEDSSEQGAQAVIVGDLGEAWDFKTLNRAFRLLMNNPDTKLIALGMTRYWRAEDGLRLDAAPFIKALEHASGREAIVLGKPSKEFYLSALDRLGCDASETIMIGDDIRGDIEASQSAGIRGLLVRTGKFQQTDLAQGIIPFDVIESIADLPGWWTSHN